MKSKAGGTTQSRDRDSGPGERATLLIPHANPASARSIVYLVREAAHRIVADCERMFGDLHQPGKEAWRDALGEAILAGRHLMSILPRPGELPEGDELSRYIETLAASVAAPRERIVKAMSALLGFVPIGPDEELLLSTARSVRTTAIDGLVVRNPLDQSRRSGSSQLQANADPLSEASRKRRILVTDDEAMVRSMLRRMLTRLGYEVLEAANGRLALELARREVFDVILTDIKMPEMDGIELLRLLKSDPGMLDVPVIVISSQDDLRSVVRCIELGAEDHIGKPFDALLLQARVRASFERKRLRDLELDYQRRVSLVTSAAEAVERDVYVAGSLRGEVLQDDPLGRLARVFDRMVGNLKTREERLQHRLGRLRHELTEAGHQEHGAAVMPSKKPFHLGDVLASRYEIRADLGAGGMGMVYRARDRELGEDVALKIVHPDLVAEDPALVERLKSEIRLARRISHRNVVRSHDLGEWNGTYFITMEYVEGLTVAQLIDRRARLSVESTLAIGIQLSDALAVAHEAQIIHRDIKPANLLVDRAGTLKVMDFGLARPVHRNARLSLGGLIVGTPEYMSPEQFMASDVDARSDLFAVGVVLFECLSGRTPFAGDSALAVFAEIQDDAPPRLDELVPTLPISLTAIVHQLIRRDAADRPASAHELSRRLAEIEHDTQPPRPSPAYYP